jgi:hypothetical protein
MGVVKMTENKKYQYYTVDVINNENGSKENIEMLNSSEIEDKKTDWNEMLDVYRKIKDQYKDQNVTIEFCGSSDSTGMNVIYTKVFNPVDDENDKEEESSEDLFSLFGNMNGIINKINRRTVRCNQLLGLYDKNKSIIEHNLEALKQKNIYELSEDEKLNILNIAISLQSTLHGRRDIKLEMALNTGITHSNLMKKVLDVNEEVQSYVNKKSKENKNRTKLFEESKIHNNSNTLIKRKYNNFKERIELIKELQKTCSNVSYIEADKMVVGYNKVKVYK